MPRRMFAVLALLVTAACGQSGDPPTEYRPGDAGTVDHAMCLLGFTAVPLREVATGHHLVDARLNDMQGSFVLDTGANVTVLSRGQAERFGVSAQATGLGGFRGIGVSGASGQASQVRIEALEIGSVAIRQKRIVIADLNQLLASLGQIAGEDVAGIIGQDVLSEHRAIIDVARPMLYLMASDEEPAPVQAERCREAEQDR